MRKFLMIGATCCSVLFHLSYGQSITTSALSITLYDDNGDPINNVIDADNAKQGDFIYQDCDGLPIYKERFINNVLINRSLNVGINANASWIIVEPFISVSNGSITYLELLTTSLKEQILNWENKQILIFKNDEVAIKSFLGNWSSQDKNFAQSIITNYLNNFSNAIPSNYQFIIE